MHLGTELLANLMNPIDAALFIIGMVWESDFPIFRGKPLKKSARA
jgi:hypothetical protein